MKTLIIAAAVAAICTGCSAVRGITAGTSSPTADVRPIGPNGERLNRIPGTTSIDIPAELDEKAALDAFEATIVGTGAGSKSIYWASQWRIEGRDPGNKWIRVSLTNRQHYLSVCYRVEDGKLIPDVPTSSNLKQDGIKIHRKVPAWINRLNPLVSSKLYEAAKARRTATETTPKK